MPAHFACASACRPCCDHRTCSLLCVDGLTHRRWGPLGYLAYGGVYALLELAIIPAIPLTMTAGVLFGVLPGLAVVSASGTLAATLSFLIARYAARDKVRGARRLLCGQPSMQCRAAEAMLLR